MHSSSAVLPIGRPSRTTSDPEPPSRPHMRGQAQYVEGIQNCGENCGEYRNEENDLNGDRTFEILH